MKKILIATMIAFSACSGLMAQQDPEYSMYMFNGLFINPAYAGSQEVVSVMGIYRHQWAGIEGAPKTANISVHTPFRKDQYAIGMTISNDRLGLSNNFNVTPSFAYRLRFKNDIRLSFGVQASFAYFYQNNGRAEYTSPIADQSFAVNENLFVPNFGFGVYAYGKRWYVGASVPHLLPATLSKKTGVSKYEETLARLYNHYLFTAGYLIGKESSVVKFRPTILMKWQKGLIKNIPQFDINLALLFIDRLWFGAGYRTKGDASYFGQSVILFAAFKVTPQLQIGYAYDVELTRLRKHTSGTHEIMVGYDFWYNKKRFVTPRYIKYF